MIIKRNPKMTHKLSIPPNCIYISNPNPLVENRDSSVSIVTTLLTGPRQH